MRNVVIVAVVVAVAIIAYVLGKNTRDDGTPQYVEQPIGAEVVEEEVVPEVKYPVPEPPPSKAQVALAAPEPVPEPEPVEEIPSEPAEPVPEPLPDLDMSDTAIYSAMGELSVAGRLTEFFGFDSIVRHFVVTVDNMTSDKLPRKYRFYKPLKGSFLVVKESQEDDSGVLDPENYKRYAPLISMIEAVDLERLTGIYIRYYPLFQDAYEELGYPNRYFNDRFVEVIDHLLETPDVDDPIALTQPKVFYVFADPDLEALSAGQKLLIRMGADNAARVKIRLNILRSLLTNTR